MIMKKLILGTLMAGCLSIGASFADDTKPAGPSAEQKVKLEELKAKLEAARAAWKAGHDSLTAEHKAEIQKRIADHKAEMDKRKAAMDALKTEAKTLIDGYKTQIKGASDSEKVVLAKELAAKLKALRDSAFKGEKAQFDMHVRMKNDSLDMGKGDWEKKLKDRKAEFDARIAELKAKRDAWEKAHAGDSASHGKLTAEQEAALKAKFEEWLKTHTEAAPAKP